jgi:hypothetical protein
MNTIKNRIDRLSKSKPKGIHVFIIQEWDPPDVKERTQAQIKELENQGEDPLLITIKLLKTEF